MIWKELMYEEAGVRKKVILNEDPIFCKTQE